MDGINGKTRKLNHMKTLIHKLFTVFICTFAFDCVQSYAQENYQLETKTLPVSDFTSISVEDDFEITLLRGPQNVKVTAYRDLMPYIQVYVRGKVLYITYDERSVPKDVKKQYKGRGTTEPVFRAMISLHELNGITLSNNASLISSDEFSGSNRFDMVLGDKAQVKSLNVQTSSATVSMKKNAQAVMTLTADKHLEVSTDGNANLKLTATAPEMQLNAAGSSDWTLVANSENATLTTAGSSELITTLKTKKAVLKTSGSSEITLSGEAESLEVQGEKSSEVEAAGFTTKTIDANLSGSCKVNVAVTEGITATLVGGSSLYYTGTPAIKIGKIIKSTLAPAGSK